jgi:GAF domain
MQEEQDQQVFTELSRELNDLLEGKHLPDLSSQSLTLPRNTQEGERNPFAMLESSPWLADFLQSSIAATAADFGNVQLFDSSSRVLKIVAQRGFNSEFLGYFEAVSFEDGCACGAALKQQTRIVVSDVTNDPIFADQKSKDVLLSAKVRSVQSTPLFDLHGQFVGVVSTHYRHAGGPVQKMCDRVDDLAAKYQLKTRASVKQA